MFTTLARQRHIRRSCTLVFATAWLWAGCVGNAHDPSGNDGSAADSGASNDDSAVVAPDSPVGSDATTARDAGPDAIAVGSDATMPADASRSETGSPNDASAPTDSGASTDVGTPSDASDPTDGGAATDAGTTACPALTGPFGTTMGDVVDPSLAFEGYAPGSTTSQVFHMGDFYDCDGSRGINAITLTEASVWCPGCGTDSQDMNMWAASSSWRDVGVVAFWFLYQNGSGLPGTVDDARGYREALGLDALYVLADPTATFQPSGAFIVSTVIDPRTLRIVQQNDGYYGNSPIVTDLATSNRH